MHIWTLGTLAAALAPVTAQDLPTAIRRMPADPNAKFYPHYAAYSIPDDIPEPSPLASRAAVAAIIVDRMPAVLSNGTSLNSFWGVMQPVFRPHEAQQAAGKLRRAAEVLHVLHVLQGRSGCPSGFSSCDDIGFPNKCCVSSETCVKVDNERSGNVACCASGSDCSGDADVAECPSTAVSCAASLGGGCCIAGYECKGSGCVKTVAASGTTTTTSTTTATTTSETTTMSTTGTSAVAPFRPTSDPTSSTTDTAAITSSATLDNCPTGYYPCLARYGGGCCQTGRDCQETSCAPTLSTTIVSRTDLTIAIAASDTPTTTVEASGSCATGWFLCAATPNVVGGCCPDNYVCGSVSCTLSSGGEATAVGKQSTVQSVGLVSRPSVWFLSLGLLGVMMV